MSKSEYPKSWDGIRNMLGREGFKSPAALSSLLLNTFFKNKGVLGSINYTTSKCHVPGLSYSLWIQSLKQTGWLKQVTPLQPENKQDYIRYEAGCKLVEYINEEKAFREEMASMREVFESGQEIRTDMADEFSKRDAKIASLEHRIGKIEDNMQEIYDERELGPIDPPHFKKLRNLKVVK